MDTNNIATIILRNSQGQLYVHKRSPHKRTFPNLYGLGAGGHIRADESPEQAAQRELLEETGIDAQPTFIFAFPFTAHDIDYKVHVFELVTDQPIEPDDHEWQESGWLSIDEINALGHNGKLMPDTKLFFERYIRLL